MTWVTVGPVAVILLFVLIIANGSGWFTFLDASFGIVVGLMLLGRWIEQRSGAATTPTGEPATHEQFLRYMKGLPLVAAGLWVVANLLGNHVFA